MKRRRLIAVASVGFLSGCLDEAEDLLSDDDATPGTRHTPTNDDTSTEEGPASQDDSEDEPEDEDESEEGLVLEYKQEYEDRDLEQYEIQNNTPDLFSLITIEAQDKHLFYRVRPGESTRFTVPTGSIPLPVEDATWTEGEYQQFTGEVDVSAVPTGIATPEISTPSIEYEMPNPTNLDVANIEQIESEEDFRTGDSGFEITSRRPLWTRSFEAEVSTVSETREFTFSAGPAPEIDITIEGGELDRERIIEQTFTVTALSETPVMNAKIAVNTFGPNVNQSGSRWEWETSDARVDDESNTLITPTVGEERLGESRTITLNKTTNMLDLPLSEDDVLAVGVISSGETVRDGQYPIEYVEEPIEEVI